MPCTLLCTTVTDSISVKIKQKVNKYEYGYELTTDDATAAKTC